jgi:hypothetical protein
VAVVEVECGAGDAGVTFTVEVVVSGGFGLVGVVLEGGLVVVVLELAGGLPLPFEVVAVGLAVVAVLADDALAVLTVVAVAACAAWGSDVFEAGGPPAQAGKPLTTITIPAAAMAPPARLRRSITRSPLTRTSRDPVGAGNAVALSRPMSCHARRAPPAYGHP